MHVEDADCICILDVNLQCWNDELEDKEVDVDGEKDVGEADAVVELRRW